MGKYPLVSIIVVNWNGGEVFRNCLSSLQKIDYPKWELIVVDNGSTDESGENKFYHSFSFNYKLIKNKKNVGFAAANNQGYEVALGEYVLLLNNDTKVEPDFLSKMVNRMDTDPSIGVIQPKILLMGKPGYIDNAGSFFTRIGFLDHWGYMQKDSEEFVSEREIFSAKGACMLIRRSIIEIEKIGLFDNDFVSYFEESDFCWRVILSGRKILFYPNAKVYHKVGFTIRRLVVGEMNYHYYKNRICSLIKNLEIGNLLIILPLHICVSIGIIMAFLLRFHPKNAIIVWRALFWNFLNLSLTLEKRKKVQKMRQKSDTEIFTSLLHPIDWKKHFAGFKRVEADIDKPNKQNKRYLEERHFGRMDHIWWGSQTPAGQKRYDRKAEMLKRLCKLDKHASVLEVGCGDGEFTQRIAGLYAKIIAIDITKKVILRGEKYLNNPNVSFLVENCENLSFNNDSFDIVCGVSILHHVDINKALQEVYRVLKKGGKIFFTEPNIFNPHIFIGLHIPWLRRKMEFSPGESALSRMQVNRVLREVGFKKVKVRNYDFLHPSTPSFMINLIGKFSELFERIPIIKEISGSLLIYAEK